MHLRFVLPVVALAALAVSAVAAPEFGPAIGAVKYSSSLQVLGGEADNDDFVGSLVAGEKLTVTGNPTHAPGPRLAFQKIVKADGSELLPAAAQRNQTLEDERRERAKRRAPQG